MPVNHEVTEEFAKDIELMSNGKLKVKVFNAGELIPGLQVFDAVSQGAVQMGFAASPIIGLGKSQLRKFSLLFLLE